MFLDFYIPAIKSYQCLKKWNPEEWKMFIAVAFNEVKIIVYNKHQCKIVGLFIYRHNKQSFISIWKFNLLNCIGCSVHLISIWFVIHIFIFMRFLHAHKTNYLVTRVMAMVDTWLNPLFLPANKRSILLYHQVLHCAFVCYCEQIA